MGVLCRDAQQEKGYEEVPETVARFILFSLLIFLGLIVPRRARPRRMQKKREEGGRMPVSMSYKRKALLGTGIKR
jgi:hypothetical protein